MASFREGLLRLGTPPYRTIWQISFYGNAAGVVGIPLIFVPGFLFSSIMVESGTIEQRIVAGFSAYAPLWIFVLCLWLGAIGCAAWCSWIRSAAKRAGVWDAA
jgi:hypothetical protein